jgi:hypothetical protein
MFSAAALSREKRNEKTREDNNSGSIFSFLVPLFLPLVAHAWAAVVEHFVLDPAGTFDSRRHVHRPLSDNAGDPALQGNDAFVRRHYYRLISGYRVVGQCGLGPFGQYRIVCDLMERVLGCMDRILACINRGVTPFRRGLRPHYR